MTTLTDWRDLDAAEIAPLYEAERRRWKDRLHWETEASWQAVEEGRVGGRVPGWVATDASGRIAGWTFYILHDGIVQIGGLVSARPTVARRLIDAVLGGPEVMIARALSCFVFPDHDGVSSALVRQRFEVRDSVYLSRELDAGAAPPAGAVRGWRDDDLPAAVRLFASAYEGVAGSACFAPGGRREEWARYVAQLVYTPACGTFAPSASFCATAEGGRDLRGAIITSRLADDTAHIAQIAIDPQHRRNGLARELVTAACEAARREGLGRMTLMVDAHNEPARRLYASLGFVERARFLNARRGARTRLAA